MKTVKHCSIAGLLAVAGFGCAATDKAVTLPDGGKGYSVSCDYSGSWDSCYTKASEVCGAGYEIVSRSTEGMETHSEANFGGYKYPHAQREMVVKCIS
jgi:hypothetical protein